MANAAGRPQKDLLITPRWPAGEALRLICHQQLCAIEKHRPGARLGRDPEELHDLRVAVRRSRSVLGEFRKFFPQEALAHFREEFRWVGEITGPVRDLDVYLEHLPDYYDLLAGNAVEDLAPFRRFLERHRRLEQRRLVRRLGSQRFGRLLDDWRGFLANGDKTLWPEAAAAPAGELSRRHTWKLYRTFIREGAAITPAFPDHDLHRLRITGKKLRYLVEFFRPLHPAPEIAELIKAMKGIQDYLGAHQDCTVQQQRLHILALQMAAEGDVPAATTAALEQLVAALRRRQHKLRREFSQRFAVFSHGRGRRGFIRLYAPKETP